MKRCSKAGANHFSTPILSNKTITTGLCRALAKVHKYVMRKVNHIDSGFLKGRVTFQARWMSVCGLFGSQP